MNFRIIKIGAMTRRDIIKTIARWVIYSVLLILFYSFQCTMPFARWQPLLCISLGTAVSFYESELNGVVFAIFCGMMHDLAMGGLFGFTSIWLAPCCLFVTLFTVNLIHRNFINYIWLNTCVLIIVELMELLFKHIIWRNPDIDILIINYMLPAVVSAIILSPALYFLLKFVNKKLGLDTTDSDIVSSFQDAGQDEFNRM